MCKVVKYFIHSLVELLVNELHPHRFISFEVTWTFFPGPVTIADRDAEESMVSVILENFPSHAM